MITLLKFPLGLIVVSLIAWFIGFFIILGMSHTLGHERTYQHYLNVQLKQAQILALDEKHQKSLINFNQDDIVNKGTVTIMASGLQHTKLASLAKRLPENLYHFSLMLLLMTHVVVMKTIIILLALPLFIIAGLMGVIEGLIQRDLRKFSAGRESASHFHWSKRNMQWVTWGAFTVFLVLPIAISPVWVLLPAAIAYGFLVSMTLRSFKKYVYV